MVCIALLFAALAQAQFMPGKAGPKITCESALEDAAVDPGNTLRGAVRVSISKGWHVNAHETLDEFLIPTVLEIEAIPGFDPRGVAYPGHKMATFSFSPDPMAVYEDEFVLGFLIHVDDTVLPGTYEIQGQLQYQACNDKTCAQPSKQPVTIPVTVAAEKAVGESSVPEWFAQAPWDQLEEAPIALAQAEPGASEASESVTSVEPVEETPVPEPALPAEPEEETSAPEPAAIVVPEGETAVPEPAATVVPEEETAAPEPIVLSSTSPVPSMPEGNVGEKPKAAVEAPTAASATEWRTLVEQFKVKDTLAGYVDKQGFIGFLDKGSGGVEEQPPAGASGWWWMVWVVVAGGLMLNLTPCVLPLIPINVAIIGAGARAGSRARGFALGGAYGLGIALVYGALGLVVVLGLSSAFGAINATAWFNAIIAALFVLLAAAMFDVIEIDFSKYQSRLGFQNGGSGHFLAALGMGAVSALLAGACVAPVVIWTILQAQDLYSQGNVFALLLPFGLGVGMALPWPFLGAGMSFLPKPGKWMVRVKQAFGLLILAFASYYMHLAYTLAVPQTAQVEEGGVWTPSLEEGLKQALEEKRLVIIDFWATWCKSCIAMDRTVLKDEEVLSRLENHVKIKFQAESLSESPVKEVVEYFQVMGLPTFIVLEPKG